MLDKLEYLLALARERNFGRAAESCGVTQPSFSAGIKQLEDTLGATLVQRTSRFIGFTAEGERVLEWARGIVSDTRSMRADVQTLKKGLSGHLRIAAMPVVLPMLVGLTTPYHAKYPGVRFSLLSRTTTEILTLLDNLEIDAGIMYIDGRLPRGVRSVPFYRERYRLVTAPDSPPRASELGRGCANPLVPAGRGHADPQHHRRPAERGQRRDRAAATRI